MADIISLSVAFESKQLQRGVKESTRKLAQLDKQAQRSELSLKQLKLSVKLRREIEAANRKLGKFNTTTKRSAISLNKLSTAAKAMGAAFGAFIALRIGKELFNLATTVEETGSKFKTVFGASSEAMDAFIKRFGTLAGLSRTIARDMLATTAAIAQGMGFAQQASAKFAESVLRLSADVGSFNNLPTADVIRRVQAALTGERESLKRLGIVILETDVQQRALNISGKSSVKQLTQQEKATATLQLITEKAGVAMGDLARTQDSAANKAKRLRAEMDNLKEQIATKSLPAWNALLTVILKTAENWDIMRKGAVAYAFSLENLGEKAIKKAIDSQEQFIASSLRALGRTEDQIAATFDLIEAREKLVLHERALLPGQAQSRIVTKEILERVNLLTEAWKRLAEIQRDAAKVRPVAAAIVPEVDLRRLDRAVELAQKVARARAVTPFPTPDFGLTEAERVAAVAERFRLITEANNKASQQFQIAWEQAIRNSTDILADFISGSIKGLDELASRFADLLLQIAAQQAAARIIGFIPVPGAAAAPTAKRGGIVGGPMPVKLVDPRVFIGAPHFARGGLVGDEVPIIAHRGERVLPKGQAEGITVNQNIGITLITPSPELAFATLMAQKGAILKMVAEGVESAPGFADVIRGR